MKEIKTNLGYYEFQDYVQKFEDEIINVKGVTKILTSDLDEEIPHSGGIFRREYWGKGKSGDTKVKRDLLYLKTPDDIYSIYEYE